MQDSESADNAAVGTPACRYYDHPEVPEAYEFQNTQYKFGQDILVSPITEPAPDSPVNGSVGTTIWIPEGSWVEWGGEVTHVGPMILTKSYSQREVPVFVKAGAVVPLKTMGSVALAVPGTLVWLLFPAARGAGSGSGRAYEDDGETVAAKAEMAGRGDARHSSVTTAHWSGGCGEGWSLNVTIASVGCHAAMPETRMHALQLRGCSKPPRAASVDGIALPQTRATLVPEHQDRGIGGGTLPASREPSGEAGWWTGDGDAVEPSLLHGDENTLFVGLGRHPSCEASFMVVLEF